MVYNEEDIQRTLNAVVAGQAGAERHGDFWLAIRIMCVAFGVRYNGPKVEPVAAPGEYPQAPEHWARG